MSATKHRLRTVGSLRFKIQRPRFVFLSALELKLTSCGTATLNVNQQTDVLPSAAAFTLHSVSGGTSSSWGVNMQRQDQLLEMSMNKKPELTVRTSVRLQSQSDPTVSIPVQGNQTHKAGDHRELELVLDHTVSIVVTWKGLERQGESSVVWLSVHTSALWVFQQSSSPV